MVVVVVVVVVVDIVVVLVVVVGGEGQFPCWPRSTFCSTPSYYSIS